MTKKEKGKSLEELRQDLRKAQRDLQTLGKQQLMVQGVITYLNQEIVRLETPEEEEKNGA